MGTATLQPPEQDEQPFAASSAPAARRGEPVWALAERYPHQGDWDDADFWALDLEGGRVELVDGCLEFLPVPLRIHDLLSRILTRLLEQRLGVERVACSGYKLRIRDRVPRQRNDYRDPDVMASTDASVFGERFATAASLVIEVLSPGASNREQDLEAKRVDYAEAGVPEYWIVDPEAKSILLLRLKGDAYEEAGTFGIGDTAPSTSVPGFGVNLSKLFETSVAS